MAKSNGRSARRCSMASASPRPSWWKASLISSDLGTLTKRSIRDRIRLLPDGEIEWQKCQALLYGQRIAEAKLVEGVADFIRLCRERGIPVHIVSHKTEF